MSRRKIAEGKGVNWDCRNESKASWEFKKPGRENKGGMAVMREEESWAKLLSK